MKPFVVSLCGALTLLLAVTNLREDNYVSAQDVLRLGKDFDINDGTTTSSVLPNVVAPLRSLQGNANGNSNGNANGNAK